MIKRFGDFKIPEKQENQMFPLVRHLTSYESAISIIENRFLMSRNEMKKNLNSLDDSIIENKRLNSKDIWWNERKETEKSYFGTEDIIYCTVDWLNSYKHESGHGPVMIYLKSSLFEDFNVTLTIEDSLHGLNDKIYENNEILELYSNVLNETNLKDVKKIKNNIGITNSGSYFNTSKGKVYIEEGRFYNKYSEIQIHAKTLSINYIKEIKLTDNYFDVKENDKINKEKLISICNNFKLKITQ